jgi:uncharacterized membrane protein YdjX (TVP38/TMEM64 family)
MPAEETTRLVAPERPSTAVISPDPRTRNLRLAAVAAVAVGLVVAWRLGVFQLFRDPAHVRECLVALGPLGYLAFIVAYALLQPFGVPGTVFVFAAPLIWPWPTAFALSMAGTMAASVVGFSFARFVARDWVSTKIPAKFKTYEDALAARGFATVAFLRFVFWMPPLLHAFFGVSKVSFRSHFWGSLVGYLVPLFFVSYFGQRAFDAMREAPAWVWAVVAATTLAFFASFFLWQRRKLRAKTDPEPAVLS